MFLTMSINKVREVHAQQTISDIGGYKLIVPLPVPLPGLQGAAPETLAEYVRFLYLWFIGVVALAAGIMVTVGGVRYLLATGNPGKEQDAKDQISHALLGLIVALGSYLILRTINPSLVNLGASELPMVNLPVSQTFRDADGLSGAGLCFPKDQLYTNGCADIGIGWLDHPEGPGGCYNSCNTATQLCCLCAGECDATEHSCVKLDPEGVPNTPNDPGLCGPFLRADCADTCPETFPDCVPGNYCGDPISQTFSFQIMTPQKPSGGNTQTPITLPEGAPLMITVHAQSTLDMVLVQIFDPSGAQIGNAIPCTPSGGDIWTCQWTPTIVPGSGTYRIEATGRDASGNVLSGMSDSVRVCFTCGPAASFTVAPAIKSSIAQATACPGLIDTFAPGPSGAAILIFSAGVAPALGGTATYNYAWYDNGMQLPISPAGAQTIEAPLTIASHEVRLVVTDSNAASGEATKSILVVGACP